MDIDSSGLERLDYDECLRLLRTVSLGRIAVSWQALPVIVPVEFALDGADIVIRSTASATVAMAVGEAAVVGFEADDADLCSFEGWSVSITGSARVVREPDELARLTGLTPRRWASEPIADSVIRLHPTIMSGRRFRARDDGGHGSGRSGSPTPSFRRSC